MKVLDVSQYYQHLPYYLLLTQGKDLNRHTVVFRQKKLAIICYGLALTLINAFKKESSQKRNSR